MHAFKYTYYESPVGRLLIAGRDRRVTWIRFPESDRPLRPGPDWQRSDVGLVDALRQLEAYFAGKLTEFDIALDPAGTAFQKKVWKALQSIPYGQTRTYGQIAQSIHHPKAFRAVGAANNRNPIPIVVPCHRVIGKSGGLVGFGGGLDTKRALLQLEGAGPASGWGSLHQRARSG